jgi:predicted MFS family arabinose efflux permease
MDAQNSAKLRSDMIKYFAAVALMGAGGAMVDSSFNNFLKSNFEIGGLARSALELPREIPGFLNVFIAAALAFLPGRRVGAVSFLLQAVGIACLGFFSPTFRAMTGWLFVFSVGQHLFIPLQQSIGMELAKEGGEGARLGQANAVKNLAQLAGGALVFLGFGALGFSFSLNFLLAAVVFLGAGIALATMSSPPRDRSAPRLVLKRRYGLFYLLSILFGTRKQLFITFAPWVVVSVFGKPTSVVAALYFAGGLAGVVFQPVIGRAVDKHGERFMLGLEALILIPVCILYGFSRFFLPEAVAFAVVCACYVADSLLLSFGMARSTWLRKIAEDKADVAPTLAMGVSIDHVFSISVALVSGVLWDRFGFQWVFLVGAVIACLNFLATRWIGTGIPRSSRG